MERLRITIEFNRNKKDELNLYEKLQKYSNPAAYVKDVLRGLLPIPSDIKITTSQIEYLNNRHESVEDDEDLMDI